MAQGRELGGTGGAARGGIGLETLTPSRNTAGTRGYSQRNRDQHSDRLVVEGSHCAIAYENHWLLGFNFNVEEWTLRRYRADHRDGGPGITVRQTAACRYGYSAAAGSPPAVFFFAQIVGDAFTPGSHHCPAWQRPPRSSAAAIRKRSETVASTAAALTHSTGAAVEG